MAICRRGRGSGSVSGLRDCQLHIAGSDYRAVYRWEHCVKWCWQSLNFCPVLLSALRCRRCGSRRSPNSSFVRCPPPKSRSVNKSDEDRPIELGGPHRLRRVWDLNPRTVSCRALSRRLHSATMRTLQSGTRGTRPGPILAEAAGALAPGPSLADSSGTVSLGE